MIPNVQDPSFHQVNTTLSFDSLVDCPASAIHVPESCRLSTFCLNIARLKGSQFADLGRESICLAGEVPNKQKPKPPISG